MNNIIKNVIIILFLHLTNWYIVIDIVVDIVVDI